MAFRLQQGRSIEGEVRRIVHRQLCCAIAGMRGIGDRKSDEALHEARQHIKKVRALIRLVGPSYRGANRRLRDVSRLLAPVADGAAVVDTLSRLGRRYRHELPHGTRLSMRKALVQRWARVDRQVRADRVLRTAVALVREERGRARSWQLRRRGFRTVAAGLRRTVRDARRAMVKAIAHPTIDNYHVWRRRVKDHWFQVRLLEGRCGDGLIPCQRSLEALDGCLGEYHNCALLAQVMASEALLPRDEVALSLRLLRRYQRDLRRDAQNLGSQVYNETPRQFAKRVKRLWRSASADASVADTRPPWLQAA